VTVLVGVALHGDMSADNGVRAVVRRPRVLVATGAAGPFRAIVATPSGVSDPAPTARFVATIVAPPGRVGGQLVRLDRRVDESMRDLLTVGMD
jgi:hypothetical protein